MSNEIKSIHEFEMQLICEYYSGLERQGPGSPEVTLRALGFIDNLTDKSKIADLGCGTGGQSILLGQYAPGTITAIDVFPLFIEMLNHKTQVLNLQQKVQGIVASMDDLPFKTDEFDLIWSEGAIYNIGFVRGLNEWRNYLKKGGFIAVTEASWFTETRPAEINNFWNDAYPEIDTIPNKLAQLQNAGYLPVAAFILPENCWTENFYLPQQLLQKNFLEKYSGNKTATELVDNQRYEAELYEKYKNNYGYVFYIGKKL